MINEDPNKRNDPNILLDKLSELLENVDLSPKTKKRKIR